MGSFSAVELYLQDFHQRMAGATSAAFATLGARSAATQYTSSYAALAACIPDLAEPVTIMDLACGDGHLLKLLSDRQRPLRLIGVDMSQGELDAARAVLPPNVTLLQERAQALSIETGSVDYVLSHMALMLMDDIAQVLGEIRRVLRPQGTLAAIVGRTFLLGEVNDIFQSVFRPIAKEDALSLSFGDRRTHTEAGWTELLAPEFEQVQFTDIDVAWQPLPHELWHALTETYSIDLLSASAKERLRERLFQALTPLQKSDGTVRTGWGVRLIQAQAR